VRRARAGDERAFAELVRAYQDVAVAYAAAVLRDYDLAADAAQEAFIDAYRSLSGLRDPGAFPAWLRTIVFKHCDRITRRKRHPETKLEAALRVASPEPSPEEALMRGEMRRSVREAVAGLPDNEQEVVLLYYMGDHSHAAIGEFLGVTPNAVKTRLYSARRRLRTRMAEIEEGLDAERPSNDPRFVDKVRRMIRPDALKTNAPLFWSPGMGTNVWEMFCAAITGDVAALGRLIDEDPSLLRCHYEYHTPLSFAVRENQVEAAAYLLDRGMLPTLGDPLEMARDRGYREMEHVLQSRLAAIANIDPAGDRIADAIRERDMDRVRTLLDESPGLVHVADARGNRPIHWAVMTRQPAMIDELLARGADIDAQRPDGALPIQLANGDYHYRGWRDVPADVAVTPPEVREHLRARGAFVDICTACWIGDADRVRALLAEDPSLANRPSDYVTYYACSGTPLRNAAGGGHSDIVRILLEHGADPNLPEEHIAPRGHALHAAVCNGHHDIVQLLLEHGAYPNVEIESSADTLSAALSRGDERMVELLCSRGAARPVHLLAHYNDIRTAAAVFAANPALADDPGALGSAASEEFVRLMLLHQPDLPKRATVSKTAAVTRLLFEHGMDANRPNWLRITPLHHLAESGDVEIAALFIQHGADLNAVDEEFHSTPLGWAARCGRTRMVEFLLRRGANPDLPADPHWAKPLAWANRRAHRRIAEVLRHYEEHGEVKARGVEAYESLARAFVDAYASGDEAALKHIEHELELERPFPLPITAAGLEVFRKELRKRLGRPHTTLPDDVLALADARRFVAHSYGFDEWDELIGRSP
jgi:RNA polymerase sigma factor (sigma-70 family)